jgi:TonB family protein
MKLLGARSLMLSSSLSIVALAASCGGVTPSTPLARPSPSSPARVQLDEFGLTQELCPVESAPLHAAAPRCKPADLAAYSRLVSAYGRTKWDPYGIAITKGGYGNLYAGRALTAVVQMRIDSLGIIATSDIDRSSGSQQLDRAALDAFQRGEVAPEPPACALTNGAFEFRLGMCVQVLRSGGIGWPDLPPVTERYDPPAPAEQPPPVQPLPQRQPPAVTTPADDPMSDALLKESVAPSKE